MGGQIGYPTYVYTTNLAVRRTQRMTYELWEDKQGDLAMFPETHSQEQKTLLAGEGAFLRTTFEANTWDDVMHQYHEYMDWEMYVPMGDSQ